MSADDALDREPKVSRIASFDAGDLADAIVQTVDQPLLILDAVLTVQEANTAFCKLFAVDRLEMVGRELYSLGNRQWDIPELRRLLEEVLPQRSVVEGFRVEHRFPEIGKRVMILNARVLPADEKRPDLILLAISDRTQAEQARFELEGQWEFQEKLIDSVREYLVVLDWDMKVIQANQPFYDAFEVARQETVGRLLFDIGNGQWDIPQLRQLLEKVLPEDEAFNDVEVNHEFERIGRRIMLLNGRRLDHMGMILLAIRDVTEQRHMEAEREMLVGELHHRIGNLLTAVDALVRRTLRESASLPDFQKAISFRLDGLARTQKILMDAPESGVELSEVLRLELGAQGGREGVSFVLHGPAARLLPNAAKAFAMAVHELTTNAVKHGALASQEGKIEVRWDLRPEDDETRIRFSWRERGVGVNNKPARTGFGSRVLTTVFGQSLEGKSDWRLHPDGVEFTAEFCSRR